MNNHQLILFCFLAPAGLCPVPLVLADDQVLQPGISQRVPWTTSNVNGTPDLPAPYRVELAFPNLTFDSPLAITSAPGSNRLFVVEQAGKIFSFNNDPLAAVPDPVVDLKQSRDGLQAIYGLAFHPKFTQNRFVFICYVDSTFDREEGTRVSRFRMTDDDPPRIDPNSERFIIDWRAGGHNGGCLKFGPDGCLYISSGDSEVPNPPDPLRAGQDVSNLLSSILRIDVDHSDPGDPDDPTDDRNYRVPSDNPFLQTEGARPEIWSYGFRNPWKMSFDRLTGDLWVGDVGWEMWEMIYRVERGGNYGWSVTEGRQSVLPEQNRGPTPILPPAIDHPHSEAGSITGGFVYRGNRLQALRGAYIYGDFQTGIVWAAQLQRDGVTQVDEIARTPLQLVAFGEDNDGELYLLDYRDRIYRLVANPEETQSHKFPRKLSETGLFASVKSQTPSPGVITYSINAHQWADHTRSERYFAIPDSGRISMDDRGNWQFPPGSVIAKTVIMDHVLVRPADNPTTRTVRLETQILHREAQSWRPYTYAWSADQTDAELVDETGFSRELRVSDRHAPDGIRVQTYRFAGRKECLLCHNPWVEAQSTVHGVQSASLLAVSGQQLNRDHPYGDVTAGQLQTFLHISLLDDRLSRGIDQAARFADPYDNTADLNERARAYLHVNCAHCHQLGAGGTATIALSHHVTLKDSNTLHVRPSQGIFGIADARIIRPGDPDGSVLYYRIAKRGGGRMPRAGSTEVDTRAMQIIHDWIAQLPAEDGSEPRPSPETAYAIKQLTDGSSPQITSQAIQQLTSSTRGALALVRLVDNGSLLEAVRDEVIAETKDHASVEIQDLFERFVPSSHRVQRLGAVVNQAEILSLESDIERGRHVFFENTAAACRNCHRINGKGENHGPDLSRIGKKYRRDQLLQHILEPSRFMETKYVPWLVETVQGRILSGLLEQKSEDEVVLRDSKGQLRRIPVEDIELLVRQQKSIMPDLLLRDMTRQQTADLLAFLASLE